MASDDPPAARDSRRAPGRKALLILAAAATGAGGLGVEVLAISCAGLALGYGRSGAVGLATWIAAWAIGAWCAGRLRAGRRAWLAAGALAVLAAWLAVRVPLAAGSAPPDGALASVATVLAIAFAGGVQGLFLPWLARAWDPARGGARDVSLLLGANLLGAVAGGAVFGFYLPAALGRVAAALGAGGASALGAGLGALVARTRVHDEATGAAHGTAARPERIAPARTKPVTSFALDRRAAGWIAGLATAWAAGVEWVGLRLGTLWLDGMQPALAAVLGASLLALALGAGVLARLLPRGRAGIAVALGLCAAAPLWFFVCAPLVLPLQGRPPLVIALVLVGPPLVPFGALVPALHRALEGESGRRLGDLLLHEAWGAALGVPLAHALLVPAFGLGGTLAALSLLGVLAAPALLPGRSAALAVALLAGASALVAARSSEPALSAPRLANPAFTVLAFTEDEDFAVTVVDDGLVGERALLTDSFRATATGSDYLYMRVLGHLPLLLHPRPRRVAVLAFGTGTTAGAVALHPEVERIDVLEISRAVCAQAPLFDEVNHGVLEDPRVEVLLGDGRRTLARAQGTWDVVTMEPLLPDSPFAVYLYTPEFYARVRAALAPGGLLCQWVPPHALEPATFDAVVGAFTAAFGWSGVFLFGTQVVLVGAEAPPALDPGRFPGGAPIGTVELQDELADALEALGLRGPDGVVARFVTRGADWPRSARPLSDADPWIVYRPRRRGAVRLADLPRNLARLRELERDPPPAWSVIAGAEGWRRLAGLRAVHRAREAWERSEAERRGVTFAPDPALGKPEALESFDAHLPRLAGELAGEPEAAVLLDDVRFVRALEAGWAALLSGHDAAALDELTRAAVLKPRRARVHLLVAIAAARLGSERVAAAAARRAFESCPRLLETPQGRAALALGLPPELQALAGERP